MTCPAPEWQRVADALLQREALLCRIGDGRSPADFAGLFVSGESVKRILRSLPGLDGPDREAAGKAVAGLETALGAVRAGFREALTASDRFARLVRSAGADHRAAEVLALVAAVELSPDRQRLVAYVQDSVQLPRLTMATLARMMPEPGAAALVAPDAPLRRARLVDLDGDGSWATGMCVLPQRVAWHLYGEDSRDPSLPPAARAVAGLGCPEDPQVLLVHGADRETRLRRVRSEWAHGMLVTPLPETPRQWEAVVREATVSELVVVLETDRPLADAERWQVEHARHLTWAVSSNNPLPLESLPRRSWTEAFLRDGAAGVDDWVAAVGVPPNGSHRLDRDQLRLVATAAGGEAPRVGEAVRRLAGGHLEGLAVRVRPRRGWDDLVLPADDKQQLAELVARHRHRGTVYGDWGFLDQPSSGVVALFSGPSGTGKTLAAEVVADALGLDLYKVDLSAVVSKYIGETEKNLSAIFDAASAGDLVLFFDEADALFGKRSEVTDAHDRYANVEVAYLLQRLESYDGLVVLATNMQRNLDPAFLRRISVAVDFSAPDQPERRAIWERSFAPGAPTAGLDLDFLATRFKVTGGVIHNAALTAAFLAADAGDPIAMEHVALALKREFQKLGRLRTETDFDRYFDLVTREGDAAPAR